jgi:hypothetical protein
VLLVKVTTQQCAADTAGDRGHWATNNFVANESAADTAAYCSYCTIAAAAPRGAAVIDGMVPFSGIGAIGHHGCGREDCHGHKKLGRVLHQNSPVRSNALRLKARFVSRSAKELIILVTWMAGKRRIRPRICRAEFPGRRKW